MPEVAVVTDTTHYLPPELAQAAGIESVSLYVNWSDGTEREAGLDLQAFYDRLRASDELPTTSQPSIGDFLAVYEPLVAAGRDVLSLHLSGGVSGTVESARQAAAELGAHGDGPRVQVVDSGTGCGGLGLVVLAAAKAARAGGDLETVAAAADEAQRTTEIFFAVDTLEYLQRGGRLGRAQALVGAALQIKPILSISSEIFPIDRVRTSRRAFEKLVSLGEERRDAGADGWVVQHIQAHEQAELLVERGRAIFGSEPVWVSEIGPVIGIHVGPGLLGIGGCARELVAL